MPNAIAIFTPDRKEYLRLTAAAALLESETGRKCQVKDIYYDYGQDWMWTTISIESNCKTFPFVQALNPKQQGDILYGTLDQFYETVRELVAHYNA